MRYTATDSGITTDALTRDKLRAWIEGIDPDTGIQRGRVIPTPDADLLLDATINAPKSYSVVALIDDELAGEYEALQDRLRDRIVSTWQRELNARRGAGGAHREELARIEVVELRHERSRSLDPHKHRHLWLNMKVQGRDGKWSNLDSRVALRFQTVVNAEGDLAARTDPQWMAALAAKGYSLNADGEIEQLAHVVRPLSRRSNQIEANRAMKLAEWHAENPGEEPSPDVMTAIDRWAWSYGRPNKPGTVDEASWKDSVRDELRTLDATVLTAREPVRAAIQSIADLDRKFLAMVAITDADKRARSASGRFSVYDIHAGATRAVAASGVIADRASFDELIEDVTARAISDYSINCWLMSVLFPIT
ncbi:relaxase domain-containing protein [Mycetocola zhadangensis]|uniref:relaxase domain-containing protein n=1 Tax=Mycetocola zhadangensis TaxID=1164595 RepID=UPI003A4E288D